jgi:steroid 5-alpha reductase family enzyme
MSNVLESWALAFAALLAFGVAGWVVSLFRRDVSIVDGMWPLMFLIASLVYAGSADLLNVRGLLVMTLVFVWSVRLSAYIFWRNHGEDEDYRYQQIRENHSPYFSIKSLYIVFGLQAALAAFISLPLLPAIASSREIGLLDLAGLALWLVGFFFESVGDWQLARFRSRSGNQGKVLDYGLWRYTRHPNYFGDFCVWWGFYLVAVSAGGWWAIASPLLISFLLLKVSGVALLERDIADRRPKYAQYKAQTNAFFPGPRKSAG